MGPLPTQLDGQRVLITGATGGLGPSLVEAFLAAGARVLAVARRPTGLDALRAEMRQHEQLEVAECDVGDPGGVARLFDATCRAEPLDTVVHAAGAFRYGPLAQQSDDDVVAVLRSNVIATVLVVREAVRHLQPRGAGSIIVVAADRALAPAPGFSLYGAAKAAVTHLVQATAEELHGTGPRINALLPGTIDTSANREAMPGSDPSRWASPRAVARSAVWLAGPDSMGVSGALVRIPGA